MPRRGVGPWSQLLLLLIVAAAAGFGVWAHGQKVTATARGEGVVQPIGKSVRVFSVTGGTAAPHVLEEGMPVFEGQVLFRIETVTETAIPQAASPVPHALRAVIARLTAEAGGAAQIKFPPDIAESAEAARENALFAERRMGWKRAVQALRDENDRNQLEIAAQKSVAERAARARDLAQKELDLLGPLVERGISPKLESLRVQQKVQELEAQREQALLAISRLQSALQDTSRKMDAVEPDFQSRALIKLAAKRREAASLPPKPLARKRVSRETVVRAPIAGNITSLRIGKAGGTVDPGRELTVIGPPMESLLIKGRIPEIVGQSVLPNQTVTIAYGSRSTALEVKSLAARPAAAAQSGGSPMWEIDLRVDRGTAAFAALAEAGGPVFFAVKYEKPLFTYLYDRVSIASGGQVRQRLSGQ